MKPDLKKIAKGEVFSYPETPEFRLKNILQGAHDLQLNINEHGWVLVRRIRDIAGRGFDEDKIASDKHYFNPVTDEKINPEYEKLSLNLINLLYNISVMSKELVIVKAIEHKEEELRVLREALLAANTKLNIV